jgi:hypothetical protein
MSAQYPRKSVESVSSVVYAAQQSDSFGLIDH